MVGKSTRSAIRHCIFAEFLNRHHEKENHVLDSCLVPVSPRDKHLLFAEGKEETREIKEKLQAKMF